MGVDLFMQFQRATCAFRQNICGRSCRVKAWKEKHNFYKYNCVLKRLHSPFTPSTNTYLLSGRRGVFGTRTALNVIETTLADRRSGNIRSPKCPRDQYWCSGWYRIDVGIDIRLLGMVLGIDIDIVRLLEVLALMLADAS